MTMRRRRTGFALTVLLLPALVGIWLYLYGFVALKDGAKNDPNYNTATQDSTPQKSLVTGAVFTDRKARIFPASQLKFSSFTNPHHLHNQEKSKQASPHCRQWAVLTTIFKPSEAVLRQTRLKDWCLVVVGDSNTPLSFQAEWVGGDGNAAVVYLSPEDQKAMNTPFIDALLWDHFGRKNIGYLYAIAHGAEVIWDFDDDNLLKFWIEGAAPPGAPSLDGEIPSEEVTHVKVRTPQDHSYPTYNPYPVLGAPTLPSWPRGLPLADIKRPACSNTTLKEISVLKESIGVLQSLAEYQPDVDAIFRVTMPIPFFFDRTSETRPLLVPTGVLTPYNAQATLHFRNSFWALFLPVTVHSRVSDIWRSYFAQRLFWDCGLYFGFIARPLVVQDRNEHSNLGDMDAERDLYMKSESLVKFLGLWRGKGRTLVERIEELWVMLYEHQYIELHDVELVQLWIQSLLETGYKFPELNDKTFSVPVDPKAAAAKALFEEDIDPEEIEEIESCKTSQPLTFWTSDLHDGGRMDVPSTMSRLGHKTIVSGFKTTSPHPFVFEKNGVHQYLAQRSNVIKNIYVSHSANLTEQMVKENFEFYKSDDQIATVDAFFCEFPAAMCELWMPFNKTIIFMPIHRYNLGRCTPEEWQRLNEHLYALVAMESPRHFIAAKSVYDWEYLRHYTGLYPLKLYSFSGFYTANNPYAPKRDEILLVGHSSELELYNSKLGNFVLKDVHSLYPHYELSDLVSHRAIVYHAYSVMSYKLTELYSLAIPLFMPSMKFYRKFKTFGADRSSLSFHYCKNKELDKHVKPHPTSTHPYSPNIEEVDDKESEYYWLQFADFYQWPHITYYDDLADLERKLGDADFNNIHRLMVEENERRKKTSLHRWCKVIQKVTTGQRVPKNYSKAIEELYNVSQLEVY